MSFYLDDPQSNHPEAELITARIDSGIRWLKVQQNDDGGWGDTAQNFSNISTTMLVVAALHASHRVTEFQSQIEAAEQYIDSKGGIDGLKKRYGKDKTFAVPILANCAMAGIVPWKQVAALPFEAACVPQKFYNLMQLPVVSYAIPALVAIGQAKFILDPPWNPIQKCIRKLSINRSLGVLQKMQPASGGYLEATPLTSFVTMALVKSGRAEHPVVKNGIRFLISSFRGETEGQGSWPIDTNLSIWNTTLSVNALANYQPDFQRDLAGPPDTNFDACRNWILENQNTTVHPFTGAEPGGWGWSDHSGAVPDADDTPGAMLALKHLATGSNQEFAQKLNFASKNGLLWLLRLQNRDKGWPTFCRGWGKLPFDRSGNDITAHVIRGLLAWNDKTLKTNKAIESGFRYLRANQQNDGSWLPLWFGNQDQPDDTNPYYGTAKVLLAYRDANAFDTHEAVIGLRWLFENQNADGGWGGGKSLRRETDRLGSSSVEETALCTEVLLDDNNPQSQVAAQRGVDWLISAVESNCVDKSWPIGFYFAKLWYFEKLYPLIFATSALGRAMQIKHELNKQID